MPGVGFDDAPPIPERPVEAVALSDTEFPPLLCTSWELLRNLSEFDLKVVTGEESSTLYGLSCARTWARYFCDL